MELTFSAISFVSFFLRSNHVCHTALTCGSRSRAHTHTHTHTHTVSLIHAQLRLYDAHLGPGFARPITTRTGTSCDALNAHTAEPLPMHPAFSATAHARTPSIHIKSSVCWQTERVMFSTSVAVVTLLLHDMCTQCIIFGWQCQARVIRFFFVGGLVSHTHFSFSLRDTC
jgi:hypothetical protein